MDGYDGSKYRLKYGKYIKLKKTYDKEIKSSMGDESVNLCKLYIKQSEWGRSDDDISFFKQLAFCKSYVKHNWQCFFIANP
jgi:hypothetical protein